MKTIKEQAHAAATAHLTAYNLNKEVVQKTGKAIRYALRTVHAVGRAASFTLTLYGSKDKLLSTQYLGVFYEDAVQEVGMCRRCHVSWQRGAEQGYTVAAMGCEEDWRKFAGTAGLRKLGEVMDLTDKAVAGVRRICFTLADTLESVIINVAPV